MGKAVLVARLEIRDRDELREIQNASTERVAALEKLEKKLSDMNVGTAASDVRAILRVWQGVDGDPGLLERIADQMSLYEPAFSDNGREPKGQMDLLNGRPREEPSSPAAEEKRELEVVNIPALKAILILCGAAVEAGPEAFDKLDVDLPVDKRVVYVGRASLELLSKLRPTDAASLYEIAIDILFGAHVDEGLTNEDTQALVDLATKIASDGSTRHPFYEPFPISAVQLVPDLLLIGEPRVLEKFNEEEWAELTREQLQEIIQRYEAPRLANLLHSVISERAARSIDEQDIVGLTFEQLAELTIYSVRAHYAANDADLDVPARPAILDELEKKWETAELPAYEPTAAEKVQEEVLTHNPVSDPFFKDALHHATPWALERALQVVDGLDGNKTRAEMIRRRLEESQSPAAPFDPEKDPDPATAVEDGMPVEDRQLTPEEQEEEKAHALNNCRTWQQYQGWCVRYGKKANRRHWNEILNEREKDPNRPGYRDPQLAQEREETRAAAVPQPAGTSVLDQDDDDLLSDS